MNIGLVVEGHGDQKAVPVLVRRFMQEQALRYDVEVMQPFRVKRGRFSKSFNDYENALIFLSGSADVVLVILDADDDCPVALADELSNRAKKAIEHVPVHVVVANREFEAWFLAGIDSLREYRGVPTDAECPADVETIRGAKGRFEGLLETGVYSETIDQAKFVAALGFESASTNSRSFRKLVKALERISADDDL